MRIGWDTLLSAFCSPREGLRLFGCCSRRETIFLSLEQDVLRLILFAETLLVR